MYNHILVRYGELGLKGKNQNQFIKTLVRNIRKQLKIDLGQPVTVTQEQGRILADLDNLEAELAYTALDRVFGISSYSPVLAVALEEEEIINAAVRIMGDVERENKRFRVTVKRANKRFPVRSMDMQLRVAMTLLETYPELEAHLTDHHLELNIDIRAEQAYLYLEKRKGLGGLPLGSGGRAVSLLSGGIDSPVATWSIMRRGVVCEAIHFHSYPYTSLEAEEKVLKLAEKVAAYGGYIKVHLVPFTRIQEDIGQHCHDNLRITIMRRIMLRIAEEIAKGRHANALVTGDNLGQVASQTIESLRAINDVTTFPILRPLIALDKVDIMNIAKEIDTYETSILPYEDCCTVFVPKEPKTKPSIVSCEKNESKLAIEALVKDAIEKTETVICYADGRDRVRGPFEFISED